MSSSRDGLDQPEELASVNLKWLAESLIFIASEPLACAELARTLALSESDTTRLIEEIASDYQTRGIRLEQHDNHVRFVSAPEAASAIERFLRLEPRSSRLSNASLETLAIVAYRQPVTRPDIEAIRGVDVSGALRTLQQHGLITEVGRLSVVGRPLLYGTTDEFLRQFGLSSLGQLPPLAE